MSMIDEMIDKLREMPDGTKISVLDLIGQLGYNADQMGTEELFTVYYALEEAAQKANITLDASDCDGLPVGVPFIVPFAVRKTRA